MTKELDFEVEDLGTASIETKGPAAGSGEPHAFLKQTGISDDD